MNNFIISLYKIQPILGLSNVGEWDGLRMQYALSGEIQSYFWIQRDVPEILNGGMTLIKILNFVHVCVRVCVCVWSVLKCVNIGPYGKIS